MGVLTVARQLRAGAATGVPGSGVPKSEMPTGVEQHDVIVCPAPLALAAWRSLAPIAVLGLAETRASSSAILAFSQKLKPGRKLQARACRCSAADSREEEPGR